MTLVPYTRLARAEEETREQFPDATRVKALWTPSSRCEITVEIWTGNRAITRGWEPSGRTAR